MRCPLKSSSCLLAIGGYHIHLNVMNKLILCDHFQKTRNCWNNFMHNMDDIEEVQKKILEI